ncbi:MAG: Re/Si-specific NAD(P)(+) transhydrogenase subunit alpha [Candidatus Methylomirabilales bacterium]
MRVGIPKEIAANESRVALVPDAAGLLVKAGMEVLVEAGAGGRAFFPDLAYEEAGATLVPDAVALLAQADVVLKVQPPVLNEALGKHEVELMKEGTVLITSLQPLSNPDVVKRLVERKITSFSMDCIPRIARAQKMDTLSSQSTLAGYKAALVAANSLGKFFPMLVTAAGTVPPAKVLVLGAAVAGLQAIATARRLGAVVQAYDIRPAVKEQVESLGANWIELELAGEEAEDASGYARELSEESQQREKALLHRHVREADIVITTALVPGKRAPILITTEMVKDMKAGSVIVDLAAEMGGNCELTEPGSEVIKHGVTIHGLLNAASSMPVHASQMYSKNISSFLMHLTRGNELHLDFEDHIIRDCCITHKGHAMHGPTRALDQ